MKYFVIKFGLAALIILSSKTDIFAQTLRGFVNDGVEKYNEENYSDAEVNFKKGTEKAADNFEAKYNLGDALFKQKRYDEALNSYQNSLALARNDQEKAKVHYNIGNSLLKSQKIKESIEAYKQSLKLNPYDQETKYNLSYALEMLKSKNDQKQNQDQNKDQNKDKNKNKKENQDQQKQDQQKNQQQQDQKKQDQQSKQDNTKQQQQQPQKISKEEAERILGALKDNEKDLQKELRKIKGKRVKTDKDW